MLKLPFVCLVLGGLLLVGAMPAAEAAKTGTVIVVNNNGVAGVAVGADCNVPLPGEDGALGCTTTFANGASDGPSGLEAGAEQGTLGPDATCVAVDEALPAASAASAGVSLCLDPSGPAMTLKIPVQF